MIPVLALVGRPNVGKSSLFNVLTKTRQALVADEPGVTRDRQYGEVKVGDVPFILIDTGGLVRDADGITRFIVESAKTAILEADIILFLVDARAGLTPEDQAIAELLRKSQKPIIVVVNKVDGLDEEIAVVEFFELGFGIPIPISAAHKANIEAPMKRAKKLIDEVPVRDAPQVEAKGIKIALVGRPNVGKSTLTNRMLGEERVIVCDMPGTTRDSIYIPFVHHNDEFTLIDTAGVRRRGRITQESIEKFSVVKTLQAIRDSNVVIFLVDGSEGLTDQDLSLLDFVISSGRSLVFTVNKWDGLSVDQKEFVKDEIDRRMGFLDFVETFFISALHGSNVGLLFDAVKRAYESSIKELPTPLLTDLLERAVLEHNPPMVHGRRIKLKYVHCGGHSPPTLVIHGNQLDSLPVSYIKYLERFYQKALKMVGTPILIERKTSKNPYEGRREKLTPRQQLHGRKKPKY